MTDTHAALLDAIGTAPAEALRLLEHHPTLCAQEDEPSALMLALYHRQTALAEAIAARRDYLTVFEAAALGSTAALERNMRDAPAAATAHAPDGFTPLHLACFFGHADAARLLLAANADCNAVATNGSLLRPLHSAATQGSVEICRMLLEAGADPNALQQSNFTALHAAALRGNIALAELLLERGANPHAKADDGRDAAMIAVDAGYSAFAEQIERK